MLRPVSEEWCHTDSDGVGQIWRAVHAGQTYSMTDSWIGSLQVIVPGTVQGRPTLGLKA